MTNSRNTGLADLSVRDLCRALAERTPTPSGGSMAAAVGALGAATASMTLRFAEGESAAWQAGRADELQAAAERLCDLVERDAGVYDRVVAAKELAAGPERDAALAKAMRNALETPAEMMEACLGGLRLAAAGADAGMPAHLRCDCLAAAHALWAGLEDAYLMVHENAAFAGDDDPDEVAGLLAGADAMRREAAKLLVAVRGATQRATA
jgi:glutamate formiminotransferase/formiminotetrahydrofolate cyclodeaminase